MKEITVIQWGEMDECGNLRIRSTKSEEKSKPNLLSAASLNDCAIGRKINKWFKGFNLDGKPVKLEITMKVVK